LVLYRAMRTDTEHYYSIASIPDDRTYS